MRNLVRSDELISSNSSLNSFDELLLDIRFVLAFGRGDGDVVLLAVVGAWDHPRLGVAVAVVVAVLVEAVDDGFGFAAANADFGVAEAHLRVAAVGRLPDCWAGIVAAENAGGVGGGAG